jgi:hypothetical protein
MRLEMSILRLSLESQEAITIACIIFHVRGGPVFVCDFLTFTLELHGPEPLMIAALILVGGFGVLLLGYGSVVVIGGVLSLGLAEFVARVTGSKHVVEVANEKPRNIFTG